MSHRSLSARVKLLPQTLVGAALATVLLAGSATPPAVAGGGASCCVCTGCLFGGIVQCFDSPGSCAFQCQDRVCQGIDESPGPCSSVRGCPQFVPAAGAPALAPSGLTIAALVLAAFGLRGMRRRR